MSDSVIPIYWDSGAKVLSAVSTSDIPDAEDLVANIQHNYTVKSNYNSNKNMYLFLLIFFVIGNSAPYYYFENLKNKNAWPSKGFGGLLRKIIVHGIG